MKGFHMRNNVRGTRGVSRMIRRLSAGRAGARSSGS